MNATLTDAYILAMAWRMGVPEMWREDVLQEVRLACWLKPQMYEIIVARQTIINWCRHEARHVETWPLYDDDTDTDEYLSKDPSEDVRVALMDVAKEIAKLSDRHKRALAAKVNGWPLTRTLKTNGSEARRFLRGMAPPAG